jgi:gliding motility-associated transport system ATP-binding protein
MITVEGVTKRYGPLVAVNDVSFEVGRGEVVGFLGPNGAGKTTTMRMLTGTLQPDQGRVLFDGQSIGDDLTAAKRRTGYLPESNPLYEDMLVCDYLAFAGRLRELQGKSLRLAVRRAADRTGLEDVFYRPVAEASKGYRQRIGLAAAILHEPEILVLDEPTEGLDPNQRVEIRRLVSELGRERTVLLSTHVMQEVESTCSRLLIISKGRLTADGSVNEVITGDRGLAQYVIEAEGEEVGSSLAALPGVARHAEESLEQRVRVRLEAAGDADLRPLVFRMAQERGWTLWELHRERVSLEEVFRHLTTEAAPDDGTGEVQP